MRIALEGKLEQFGVLGFGGFIDWGCGVSIFPEVEEVLVLSQSANTRSIRLCAFSLTSALHSLT